MGLDKRIGPLFLTPGPGFGGSCFPKDCQALVYMAHEYGVDMKIVQAALVANEYQKGAASRKVMALMQEAMGQGATEIVDMSGRTVAVLGLAFKANTDDVRYSPSITTISCLLEKGALVRAYDPVASSNMRKIFPQITYVNSAYDALDRADACIVMTEWAEFKALDLEKIANLMKQKIVVDMRGILDRKRLESLGFMFDSIGT